MDNNETYQVWIRERGRVETTATFVDEVMAKIYGYEHGQRRLPLDVKVLLERLSENFLAKAGLAVGGAVICLVRFALTVSIAVN